MQHFYKKYPPDTWLVRRRRDTKTGNIFTVKLVKEVKIKSLKSKTALKSSFKQGIRRQLQLFYT